MTEQATFQLIAVVAGGLIAITGGFLSNTLLERQRLRRETRNLALAFQGEITAILELIQERNYLARFEQVIGEIEASREPFYMPFRIRFKYDPVFQANVGSLGLLPPPLSREIPLFYTRLASVLEDLVSIGDGTYSQLDVPTLLRVYRDSLAAIRRMISQGESITRAIADKYGG